MADFSGINALDVDISPAIQQLDAFTDDSSYSPTSSGSRSAKSRQNELIVLDSRVPDPAWFREQFAERLRSGAAELLYLSDEDDAIVRISDQLAEMDGVSAIHVISHGDDGLLWLGRDFLDAAEIMDRNHELQAIGNLLTTDADILLYGCDVGQGELGTQFLRRLSEAIGVDIAASDGITGAWEHGGDWDLEVQVGNVTTLSLDAIQMKDWHHTLETIPLNLYLNPTAAGTNTSTLATAAPTNTSATVPDFDGSDSDPGRLLKETNKGLTETRSDSIHAWSFDHTSQNSLHLNGAATMQVFAALKDFQTNKTGALEAWLLDVDAQGHTIAQLATDSATLQMNTSRFAAYNFDFGSLNYTLAAGHSLQVKIISPKDLSQGDMWIAYDTVAQPSRLTLTVDTGFGNQTPVHDAYSISEDSILNVSSAFPSAGWQARRQITFNNGMRSQALSDFPILITLDSTSIDYSLTQDDGEDLRFVDADGALLDYEIESWDEAGESRVWVRVPTIDAASNTDFIWMYYGNPLILSGENSSGVWSSSYDAVYHLNEVANANGDIFSDSTSNGFHGTNVGSIDATGPMGNGQAFDGINDRINLGGNRPFLRQTSGVTLSAWIAPDVVTGNQHIVGVSHAADPRNSRAVIELRDSEIRVYGRPFDAGLNVLNFVTTTTSPLTPGAWHHVVASIDFGTSSIRVYVDGIQQATTGLALFINPSTPDTNPMAASIGSEEDGSGLFYDGKLDEVRIERTARSADWVSAQYAAVTGAVLNIGSEEKNNGVQANDTNLDWESTAARVTSTTAHGTLSFQSNGSFQYTPDANYNGSDSFQYEIVSASGISTKGTVTLTVLPVNDAPSGTNDSYMVVEGGTLNVLAAGTLSNDSDIDGDALHASLSVGPSHGILTLRTDGSFDYVHDGTEWSSDSFTYFVGDTSLATSGLISVNLSISPRNDPPVASAVSTNVTEGGSVVVNVLASVVDPDGGGPYTTHLVGGASHGTVSVDSNGRIVYRHNGSETSNDSFRFRVRDSLGVFSNIQTLSVGITPVNDRPIAIDNTLSTNEDTPVVIMGSGLLANDSDADGDTLRVTGITNSGGGILIDQGNDTWTYTAAADFSGVVTLRYQIQDGNGGNSSADVRIQVAPVNDPPSVSDISGTVTEGGQVTIDPSSAISDVDSSRPFTRVISRNPLHGTLTIDSNGRFVYRHDGSDTVSDTAEFRVRDAGGALSGTAQITFTIVPQNDNPIARFDSFNGQEDTPFRISSAMLLANDDDSEGDPLTVTSIAASTGTMTDNGDGTWTYLPVSNANGQVEFIYRISDGQGGRATGNARLNVAAINDAPIAVNDVVNLQEDTHLSPGMYRLLSNDRDVDGNPLIAELVSDVAHGTLSLNGDGTFAYTPTANYFGADSFEYRVSDGQLTSLIAQVTIQVQSINDAPITVAGRATVNEGGIVQGNYLPAGASDIEGYALVISSAQKPARGTVTWSPNGNFQYIHDGSEGSTDSISFQVSDGKGGISIGTVNLDIRPVNDAPVTLSDRFDVSPNGRLVVTSNGVLANDADPEGSTMQVNVLNGPASGTLVMQPNGFFEYVPEAGFVGTDTFTYVATDGLLAGTSTTVTLVVLAPQGANGSSNSAPSNSATANDAAAPIQVAPISAPRPTVIPLVDLRASNTSDKAELTPESTEIDSNRSTSTNLSNSPRVLVANIFDHILVARDGQPTGSEPVRSEANGYRGGSTVDHTPMIGKLDLGSLEASAPLAVMIESLATEIDSLQEDLSTSIAAAGVVTGGILVATSTVSVGYVFWAIRTGFLMASVLSSLPAWQTFDPVPLINHLDDEGEIGDEDDAVERMMDSR